MKGRIPENIKPILEEVKIALKKIYGERLKSIILYGSYARGDATEEDSDIDLIILLENMNDVCEEILKCSEAISDLELTYDTLISITSF